MSGSRPFRDGRNSIYDIEGSPLPGVPDLIRQTVVGQVKEAGTEIADLQRRAGFKFGAVRKDKHLIRGSDKRPLYLDQFSDMLAQTEIQRERRWSMEKGGHMKLADRIQREMSVKGLFARQIESSRENDLKARLL